MNTSFRSVVPSMAFTLLFALAVCSPAAEQLTATKDKPFINSLGMMFVPVPGVKALFCIHDTRVADWTEFSKDPQYANLIKMHGGEVSTKWKQPFASRKPSYIQSNDDPVVMVSWQDARAFCEWLSKKEDKTYRLPTDLEWSAAVGLGKETGATPKERNGKVKAKYPWGDNYPPKKGDGNYWGPEADGDKTFPNDGYAYTSPFMAFKTNKFGLHDMGGNVWQWCDSDSDASGNYKVMRGGSWNDSDHGSLLSSFRGWLRPDFCYIDNGFRCVVEEKPTP